MCAQSSFHIRYFFVYIVDFGFITPDSLLKFLFQIWDFSGTTVPLSFYNYTLISLIENRHLCISVFKLVLCSLNLYSFSKTRLP
jgi:hypothetical protein